MNATLSVVRRHQAQEALALAKKAQDMALADVQKANNILQAEMDGVEEERAEMRAAGCTTVYCGWGTAVEVAQRELDEAIEALYEADDAVQLAEDEFYSASWAVATAAQY